MIQFSIYNIDKMNFLTIVQRVKKKNLSSKNIKNA